MSEKVLTHPKQLLASESVQLSKFVIVKQLVAQLWTWKITAHVGQV
jgi:hypothetical protein